MHDQDAPKPESPKKDQPGPQVSQGGIQAGRDIKAGRDIAGRDIIHGKPAQPDWIAQIEGWQAQIEQRIQEEPGLSPAEKQDLHDQVVKIGSEAKKGTEADHSRLEKLVNTLAVMAPDIFEVVVATLANPLAGIGLVLKKIGDKAKVETAKKQAGDMPPGESTVKP